MGVADDGALGGLPEDLREANRGHPAGAQQVGEEVSRPYRGQLIGVPNQDEPAVPPEGGQEGPHQGHIHHGGLVHNDGVGLQGLVLVVGEDQLAGLAVKLGLQQAVDGGGFGPAGLPQALGGPARGGGQGGVQPQGVEEGQHPPQAGGLAGARPAGKEHHLPLRRQSHRLALLGGVDNALPGLDAVDEGLQPLRGQELPGAHLLQPEGHIFLRLLDGGQIAGVLPGHLLPDHPALVFQGVQAVGEGGLLHPQELPGGPQQLSDREKGVAVVEVVGELEEEPRLQALGVLSVGAQGEGQSVGGGEGDPQLFIHQ